MSQPRTDSHSAEPLIHVDPSPEIISLSHLDARLNEIESVSLPPQTLEQAHFLTYYVIRQSVCVGTRLLDHLFRHPPGDGIHLTPLMLYRHALELGDSISILLRFGSSTTANVLLRGLFETSLNLGFILEDARFHEDRASCYRAFRQIQRLNIHTRYDPGTSQGADLHRILDADPRLQGAQFPRRDLSKNRAEIEGLLNTTEFKPFWDKYKREKRKPRHWYTLYSGIQDLRSLAKLVGRESEYLLLYKSLSEVVHASDVLSGLLLNYPRQGIRVHRLRGPVEKLKETTNLAATYLVDCHVKIQKTYIPDGHEMAQWFAQWYFGPYRPFFIWATTSAPLISPGAVSSQVTATSTSSQIHEETKHRAYELYQQRIKQGALDDWLQAEHELRGQ
jgi:hypothetical protein